MASASRVGLYQQIDRLYRDGTLAGLGDGQLLERYLAVGDEAAFEAIVNLHGPMVLGLCRRFLRDPSDIEDAFQATFLILVRKAPCIRDRSLLSNWLFGVAHRAIATPVAGTATTTGREPQAGPNSSSRNPVGNTGVDHRGPLAALGTQWQVYAGARHVMPVAGMLWGDSRNEQAHSCFGETCRMSAAHRR